MRWRFLIGEGRLPGQFSDLAGSLHSLNIVAWDVQACIIRKVSFWFIFCLETHIKLSNVFSPSCVHTPHCTVRCCMRIPTHRTWGLFGLSLFFFNCKNEAKEMMISLCLGMNIFRQNDPFKCVSFKTARGKKKGYGRSTSSLTLISGSFSELE